MTEKIFSKIARKNKPFYVAEQIIQAIKDGHYKPGDKLPPERSLAAAMGVSRSSVREALSALQVLNILESRPGDGTYVKESAIEAELEARVLPLLAESDSPFMIFEARNAFEMGVVELAIDRATPEDYSPLDEALQRMRSSAAALDFEGYLKANLDFHMAIARATGNPLIERTMEQFWERTSQELLNAMLKRYWQDSVESSLEIHEEILRAIKDRDKEVARGATRRHYQEPRDYFLQKGGDIAAT